MECSAPTDRMTEFPSPEPPKQQTHSKGVLLVNVGTPEALDVPTVRRYLAEFLSDPLVIRLPSLMRWMQKPLASFIARRRAPLSLKKYAKIWTDRGSPLRAIMEDQAEALRKKLPKDWTVFIGMRYGQPSIAETLREIAEQEIDELVVVPMYPQFSHTTTGTTVDEVYRVLKKHALHMNVSARTTWYNDAGYLNAQTQLLADYAAKHKLTPGNSFLLFSAHGLPVSYVERGDPYEKQLTQSIRLIVERLGWPADRHNLAYQSRMGPAEWLKPELTETLRQLAERNEKNVIICPISFAADCLETLEEIHIEAGKLFDSLSGKLYVCPAMNDSKRFIDALHELVVRGPRPIVTWNRKLKPLMEPDKPESPVDARLDRLVMIGISLANRLGPGRGPQLAYSDPDGLACAKKPHHEVESFLKKLKEQSNIAEAFVWNTCFRFECYAWLESPQNGQSRECVVRGLREQLFDANIPGVHVNTLFGRHAWHHVMRTITGLNSGLPGDKDLVEQFRTAFQTSEEAGTAGPHAQALVEEAIRMSDRVRKETAWGRLDPGYCYAALSRVQDQLPLKLANMRHVVIGGSTTSRSILDSLYEQFAVKESAVTLVYRNHQGGNMKLLRKAVRRGRRLKVQNYDEAAIHAAIADADMVYYGIDRDEPVLDADMLMGLRDFSESPLYVVDFNTAGSTRGLESMEDVYAWTADRLEAEVEAFAHAMCQDDGFPEVVDEAETWIEKRAPKPVPPSLELPCPERDEAGHPSCGRCGRSLAETAKRSTV